MVPPGSLVEDAAADLRSLLTLRSRTSVRDRPFPTLSSLAESSGRPLDREARYRALTEFIDRGISEIVDTSHRRAAEHLLGRGPGRWRTVAQRGTDAAAEFNCGWDAYRRRRATGTSQLDDTLTALAESLVRLAQPSAGGGVTGHRPASSTPKRPVRADSGATPVAPVTLGPASTGSEPERPEAKPAPRRRRHLLLATAAASLLVGVGGAFWIRQTRPDARLTTTSAGSPRCIGLTHRVGEVSEHADEDLRTWGRRFVQAARQMDDPPRCAGLVERRDGQVMQLYAVTLARGTGVGAFISARGSKAMVLTHPQYDRFRAWADAYGLDQLGDPVRRADDGGWQIAEFTNGTIIGPDVDAPAFGISGTTRERFRSTGGLDGTMGAPLTLAYDVAGTGRVQEFTKGKIVTGYRDGAATWISAENPAADLPSRTSNVVLTSNDNTSWYVDDHQVRHWLPAAADFKCVTNGYDVTVFDHTPAWSIALFEVGDAVTCH